MAHCTIHEWDPNTDDWVEVGADDDMYPAEWSSPQDADRGMIDPKTEPGKIVTKTEPGKIVTKIEPGAQDETMLDLQDKIPEAMLDKIYAALQEKMMKKIAMSVIRPALHNGKGASSSSGLTIATHVSRYNPYAPRVFLHDCKPSHPSIIHFVVSSGVDRFPLNISTHSYCIHPGGTSSPFFKAIHPRAHGGLQGDPGGVRQAPQMHRQRAPGPSEIEGGCHQCASRFRHTPRAHGGLDFFYNKLKRCRPPFHMSMHVPFTHGITTNLSGVDRLST